MADINININISIDDPNSDPVEGGGDCENQQFTTKFNKYTVIRPAMYITLD